MMTYVVTESCIRCKYTDCVDVCPVDCFREGPNFLVIDPDECIDCTLCVAECPVEAIFAEDDVPGDQQQFKALNAELSKIWNRKSRNEDGRNSGSIARSNPCGHCRCTCCERKMKNGSGSAAICTTVWDSGRSQSLGTALRN